MTIEIIILGSYLLFSGYLIGVKKALWILAGYNEKRVADKEKLAKMVGFTYAILGALLLLAGLIRVPFAEPLAIGALAVIILQIIYVQIKMVQ
ncbi:DUF3784 domain-containing protein [Enterococcus sp.]|uniref:DUF3784 domain-containing protein n=1 Tax=Enterococcus sp. TaxID=35783 RepID=UPI002FCC969B